jgi:hypothetical protein
MVGSTSSSSPVNGFGVSIDFGTTLFGTTGMPVSNSLISKWTDATFSTRTSQFVITGVDNAVTKDLLYLSGAGLLTLVQGAPEYTDNAAAVTAGLGVGAIYRTGDDLKVVH